MVPPGSTQIDYFCFPDAPPPGPKTLIVHDDYTAKNPDADGRDATPSGLMTLGLTAILGKARVASARFNTPKAQLDA